MPPPNPRSENVSSSGGGGGSHSNQQPSRAGAPMSNAVQPFVSKPPSLEMVSHQVCCCILPLLQPHRTGAAPHACPQHSSSMVPSRPLSACSSNRASDGGALESNGIIVGNKNEFKEVSTLSPVAVLLSARVAFADARVQYTEWCKNCLDESDFHMVGGGKFVVKVRHCARVIVRTFS